MLATLGPLVLTFFGAVASATVGSRAEEEMVRVAAIGVALLFAFLSLIFAPLVIKALVILLPSLALAFNGGES